MTVDRALRQSMVDGQLRPFDVTDQALLGAVLDVPRTDFVSADVQAMAYSDSALPVAAQSSRKLLRPMVLGRMLQAAAILPGDKVLDVASGSGYSTAILAKLGARVTALENDTASVQLMRPQSNRYGFSIVEGAIDRAPAGLGPFDVIVINGVAEIEPEALLGALADGGRLVTLFGKGPASFIRVSRRSGSEIGHSRIANAAGPSLKEFAKAAAFVF